MANQANTLRRYNQCLYYRIWYETESWRWAVELRQENSAFVANVTGLTPRFAQAVRPGAPIPLQRHEEFTLTGSNRKSLLAEVRAEIERRDGPIEDADHDDD